MDIKGLLEDLENELTVFKSYNDIESWLVSTGRTIQIFNYKDVIRDGKAYIKNRLEEKLNEIESNLTANDISFNNIGVDREAFVGHTILGSVAGAALSAIFAVEFFPMLLIGGVLGAIFGENKIKENVKGALLTESREVAKKLYEKLYPIIKESQNNEKLPFTFDNLEFEDEEEFCDDYDDYDDCDEEEEFLTDEQEQIKSFLNKRRIKYLLHFTNAQNIDSIKENGILSVEELNKRNLEFCYNDQNRMDHELDYILLSISTVNKYLLRNFINFGRLRDVRVIYIDASILYKEINTHRIYCDRNAAASSCRKGSDIVDLENMFLIIIISNND